MFQFPMEKKPAAAGTSGLKSHGLKRRLAEDGAAESSNRTETSEGSSEWGVMPEMHTAAEWQRRSLTTMEAVVGEVQANGGNISAFRQPTAEQAQEEEEWQAFIEEEEAADVSVSSILYHFCIILYHFYIIL